MFIVMVIRHEAQMPVFLSSVCELIVVPRKVPLELFMELENYLPKFVWNHKEPKVSKTALNSGWDWPS